MVLRGLVLVALLCALACDDSEMSSRLRADAGVAPSAAGVSPAVMVATQVIDPEGFNLYVGAYPSLPSAVDLSKTLEVPSGNAASAFGGTCSCGAATTRPTRATTWTKKVDFSGLAGSGSRRARSSSILTIM